jgi:F0F1-type ATP synthase membrane subunit c/vacuolar-type H+-ATPase subunit K
MKKKLLGMSLIVGMAIITLYNLYYTVNAVVSNTTNSVYDEEDVNYDNEIELQDSEDYSIMPINEQEGEPIKETSKTEEEKEDNSASWGYIAAALATGLACIGAGIAVAVVASSAVGALSENPSLLGKTIIFAGLAEGIAIYGLIISIMILNKI